MTRLETAKTWKILSGTFHRLDFRSFDLVSWGYEKAPDDSNMY